MKKNFFNCLKCGSCCRWEGNVLLTSEDITNLSVEIKISEEEFINKYTQLASNRIQLSLIEKENGECIFLENNKCLYYHARPKQCKDYPIKWNTKKLCPGFK